MVKTVFQSLCQLADLNKQDYNVDMIIWVGNLFVMIECRSIKKFNETTFSVVFFS